MAREVAEALDPQPQIGADRRHPVLHVGGQALGLALHGLADGADRGEVGIEDDAGQRQHRQQEEGEDELGADLHGGRQERSSGKTSTRCPGPPAVG